jgi:BirA family biotin operon repressor/biotin-[acetyl-CoA-carboxylase] ligase
VGFTGGGPGPPGAGGTSLLELTGRSVDRDALLDALLGALADRRTGLGTEGGRRRLADEWRGRCGTLGCRVRVELSDGWFEGTAADLDEVGHLVVRTTAGLRAVLAGDVIHLRTEGPGPTTRGQPGSRGSPGPN